MAPEDLKYTREHEWVRLAEGVATVGITEHAQHELGDIVYVEPPAVGSHLSQGDEAAVVESTKAAASVYAPLAGTVAAANEALAADPGVVNRECYGTGWIYRLRPDDPAQLEGLMDAAAYEAFLGSRGEGPGR